METQSFGSETSKIDPRLKAIRGEARRPLPPDIKQLAREVGRQVGATQVEKDVNRYAQSHEADLKGSNEDQEAVLVYEKTLAAAEEAITYKDEEIDEQMEKLGMPREPKKFLLIGDTYLGSLNDLITKAQHQGLPQHDNLVALRDLLLNRRELELRKVESSALNTGFKNKK